MLNSIGYEPRQPPSQGPLPRMRLALRSWEEKKYFRCCYMLVMEITEFGCSLDYTIVILGPPKVSSHKNAPHLSVLAKQADTKRKGTHLSWMSLVVWKKYFMVVIFTSA